MNMDSEDIIVARIEENMRGPEHFHENILIAVREASGLHLSEKRRPQEWISDEE